MSIHTSRRRSLWSRHPFGPGNELLTIRWQGAGPATWTDVEFYLTECDATVSDGHIQAVAFHPRAAASAQARSGFDATRAHQLSLFLLHKKCRIRAVPEFSFLFPIYKLRNLDSHLSSPLRFDLAQWNGHRRILYHDRHHNERGKPHPSPVHRHSTERTCSACRIRRVAV
jgi:hypothetical protein